MNIKKEIEITKRQAGYLRVIAFNRFLDNVEKGLKGDEECKDNLLNEDLKDMREYIQPIMSQLTGGAV